MSRRQRPAARTLILLVSVLGLWLAPSLTSASRGDTFAYIVESSGNFDKLDLNTGAVTVLHNAGQVSFGLAFSPQGVLYGVNSPQNTSTSIASLYTINTATGVPTLVGSTGVALTTLTSLANGTYYAVGWNDSLYSINPTTGAATLVGPTGLAALSGSWSNSLASDGTHLFYTLDFNDTTSILYQLNLITGAATEIGSTGVVDIIGSAFAGPTFQQGNLYGFQTNGHIDLINTTTGQATFVSQSGATDVYGGVGIIDAVVNPPTPAASVPEPSTLALVGFGGLGLASLRWWRRRKPSSLSKFLPLGHEK
jgi:hypothetical protein